MPSIARSDSVSAVSSASRNGLAASLVGRLMEAKPVAPFSAIIGNKAFDRAMQINGHVGNKTNNFHFKYLVLSCNCEAVKAFTNTRPAPHLSAIAPLELHVPAPARHFSHLNSVSAKEILSLGKERQNVKLSSKATGKPVTFCVITPRRVRDNFISRDLLLRLGFRANYDRAVVSTIKWDSQRLLSTGYLDLSLLISDGTKSIPRRFYVVNDAPFDMLIGANAVEFSRT